MDELKGLRRGMLMGLTKDMQAHVTEVNRHSRKERQQREKTPAVFFPVAAARRFPRVHCSLVVFAWTTVVASCR